MKCVVALKPVWDLPVDVILTSLVERREPDYPIYWRHVHCCGHSANLLER